MESPFKPDILKGKVALITGGGSGIGFEISAQLGKHGAAVAIMGRRRSVLDSAVDALRSQGILAIGFEGDVRKQEDANRVVESTIKNFARLDILVNGAAGNFLASPEDLSPNAFRTVLDIDTVGTYTMCHEALKYLKKGGPGKDPSTGGLILNISATLHYTATWYQIHVCAAKAAIDSITRSLALEWGTDYDIRVNGIAPGPIGGTPGVQKLLPEETKSKVQEYMPLYRLGEKWDIAMAALYLASDADDYFGKKTHDVWDAHIHTHQRKDTQQWVDARAQHVNEEYTRLRDLHSQSGEGSSAASSQAPSDFELWTQAVGRRKKGMTYGLRVQGPAFDAQASYISPSDYTGRMMHDMMRAQEQMRHEMMDQIT